MNDTQAPGYWLDGALVFLTFFIAGGDPPPHRNEAHYLARLKHYWDPDWCAGDFFLETPDAHFTVVWLFGWVTLLASLEAAAWVGRVLCWTLLAWGWVRLSRRVAPFRWVAPLTAALLVVLTEQTHFAGEWVIGGFEAKCVAYGLLLHALREWLDDRWNRAWILLGAASAFHVLVGGWSVVALLCAWALQKGDRPSLVSMAPGLVAGGALALLGVAPALALNRGVEPEVVAEANEVYVFRRLAHHLAPLSKEPTWIARRALKHLLGLALLAVLWRSFLGSRPPRWRLDETPALRRLVAFALASLAISFVGLTIEVVLWTDPRAAAGILRYYFFRLADVAPAIASASILGAAIGCGLRSEEKRAATLAAWCVAVCLWGVGGHVVQRAANATPPAEANLRDVAAWREMCAWIASNTEADATFLAPRGSHTFKWRTGRPDVVTYKDVPQNAEGLVEWKRRYDDVFRVGENDDGSPRYTRSLAGLGSSRLRSLAARYGASYALDQSSSSRPMFRASLPVVHRVGPYTLYDLRP